MSCGLPIVLAALGQGLWAIVAIVVTVIVVGVLGILFLVYGNLWFQAYMSGARVSMLSLVGMTFRQVNARTIVQAKIMAMQAGIGADPKSGITTRRLEAHYLAGGNVPNVIRAIIVSHPRRHRPGFRPRRGDRPGGPRRPRSRANQRLPQSDRLPGPAEIASHPPLAPSPKNGVELKVRARVTVRTNLSGLIGGATEETIIARVGEGIITSIGSADTHLQVMENPDRVSRAVLDRGLDAQTAFEIVSIDIADIDVGEKHRRPGSKPIRPKPTPASPRRMPKFAGRWPPRASKR